MTTHLPRHVTAMAATTTDRRTFDEQWRFERKLDGYRCLARVDGGEVALRSRNDRSFDEAYPEIAGALQRQCLRSVVLDGEIVAPVGDQTSFERLQQRAGDPSVAIRYVVFDLLWCDGHDLRQRPLEERQELLRTVIEPDRHLQISVGVAGHAGDLLAAACSRGWEGLIAKRRESTYQPRRSTDWLKLKCVHAQEFVVGGYTDPNGTRVGLGALLVGVYDQDRRLRYAGKVGTGLSAATIAELLADLEPRGRATSPFADPIRSHGVHWVDPALVVQVGFTEWTEAGLLRHPRYLGRRPDKDAGDVVREP